jgi:hypothetical protein
VNKHIQEKDREGGGERRREGEGEKEMVQGAEKIFNYPYVTLLISYAK